MDCVVDAEGAQSVAAFQRRIEKLERMKVVKEGKLRSDLNPKRPFEEMFELDFTILASPWKIWESDGLVAKRTVLKMAFEDRLP
ncbi:MAG: hypothetical protein AAGA73_21795 [Pseudomonadota bacterium]